MRQRRVNAPPGGQAEPFLADEQQPADVVERIAFAAPMTHHFLLGTLTHPGDDWQLSATHCLRTYTDGSHRTWRT